MQTYNVAVVGALGLVGSTMVRILEEYEFPVRELRLLEAKGLAGVPVSFRGQALTTAEAREEAFAGIDIALFATNDEISAELVPQAVRQGAIAIDNSKYFRMDPETPLVVPEVNPEDLAWHRGRIANPNCTTIATILALKPIHDVGTIRRVVASTYQSASGGAMAGMLELRRQASEFAAGVPVSPPAVFKYQLAFNLIPFIDAFEKDGYTREEWKMIHETRKMLHAPEMRITDTAVRVPTLVAHAVSVNIETERKVTVAQAREAFARAPGVKLVDDVEQMQFPQPLEVAGGNLTHIGRIREDFSTANGLNLWLVSDNVRKGAAQNAVQIAQLLVQQGHLETWRAARKGAVVSA
ncbi:MAG TPA: aspartate-semialdehyde dehydrogenase [Vicinamibacterales bacterium]|nr:aspartate-semialdehyde dehydrogenase [Vicinamibacterales bacterium]